MTEWISNWVNRGWKTAAGKSPENLDLWKRLYRLTHNTLFPEAMYHVEWIHVPGHAGHRENELVNQWAQEAAERYSNG